MLNRTTPLLLIERDTLSKNAHSTVELTPMITLEEIRALRERTGVGLMACKKALTEAEGCTEKAMLLLRERGHKLAAARADRSTSQGSVFIKVGADKQSCIAISLTCETDFVAQNEAFQTLGKNIIELAFEQQPDTQEALEACIIDQSNTSVKDKLAELTLQVGEKVSLGSYTVLKANRIAYYLHHDRKMGTLLGFKGYEKEADDVVASDLAMQIAATPQGALEGKKWLSQPFLKEPSLTVEQYLKKHASIEPTSFERISVQ